LVGIKLESDQRFASQWIVNRHADLVVAMDDHVSSVIIFEQGRCKLFCFPEDTDGDTVSSTETVDLTPVLFALLTSNQLL
jgi:hypothetical protein